MGSLGVKYGCLVMGLFLWLGFSLLSAERFSISSHPQSEPAELTKNPFLIGKHLIPSQIEGVVSETREIRQLNHTVHAVGGDTSSRKASFAPIKIGFSVWGTIGFGKKEVPIPRIDGRHFRYELIKRPEKNSQNIKKKYTTIRLSHRTYFRGSTKNSGGYIAELNFPPDLERGGGGDYDLLITLKLPTENINNKNTKSKSVEIIQKRVHKAFFFPKNKVNLVFLIDNSASMNRNDLTRSRFSSVYEALVKNVYSDTINEIALITFSQDAEVMLPFMSMTKFNRLFNTSGGKNVLHPSHPEFNKWTRPGRGNTDFSKAFNLAYELITANRNQTGSKNNSKTVMVFLTDGASNYPYKDEHLKLRAVGVPIYTVGLSHPDHLQEYQPKTLMKISAESGGRFFPAESEVLSRVFSQFIELSTAGVLTSGVLPLKSFYDPSELIVVSYYGYDKNQEYSRNSQKLQIKAYFKKTGKISKSRNIHKEYELLLYHNKAGVYYFSPIGEVKEIGVMERTEKATEIFSKQSTDSNSIQVGKKVNPDLQGTVRVWVSSLNKSGKVISTLYNKSFTVRIRPLRTVFLAQNTPFERINPHKPDIRYFALTNHSKRNVFVDIEFLNSKNSKKKLRNPIFEHFPLSINPKSTEIKTIIFPTALSTTSYASANPLATLIEGGQKGGGQSKDDLNGIQEYKFIVKTSEGDYLENLKFSYQDSFNKTTVFNATSEVAGVFDSESNRGLRQKLLLTSFFLKSEVFKVIFMIFHLLLFLQILTFGVYPRLTKLKK